MKKNKIFLFLIIALSITLPITDFFISTDGPNSNIVYAKGAHGGHGGGHHGGGHGSHHGSSKSGGSKSHHSNPSVRSRSNTGNRAGHSNPATRNGGSNHRIGSSNPSTRSRGSSSHRIGGSNPSSRSQINSNNTYSAGKMYNGFKGGNNYRPSDYLYSPYRRGNLRFYNYYVSPRYLNPNENDKKAMEAVGIDPEKIINPKEATYWVTIKDNKSQKDYSILLTKEQYDKINVGDDIKFVNKEVEIK
ncbi:hypothetical protein BG262_05755 [Floricoccus penangensis]|uniref:Uncharacterized protein n=1 Tax=Floricoccus penangensis TaxID=1859475 RepID=A0A9Q5JEZ6_9LACT|nr:hypothetical protein [Floricoccus penangensis]OFI45988.1 hypothetical protein BG262_05755 [Floricoccus penangensis]